MEFRLLGQFELRDGGRTHHLGGPMQRTLLGHLLLANQEPRTTDDLTRRMWGTTATDGSTSTLQVHVLRLRRLLKAAGCTATIETTQGAYRLNLGRELGRHHRVSRPARPGAARLSPGRTNWPRRPKR